MKRVLLAATVVFLALILIGAGVVYSWTFTPHGRLDLEVAILLRLMPDYGKLTVEQERENFRRAVKRVSGNPISVERLENQSIQKEVL